MDEEKKKFIEYCKKERSSFCNLILNSDPSIRIRVKSENLLISFDQLVDRAENGFDGRIILSALNSRLDELKIACKLTEDIKEVAAIVSEVNHILYMIKYLELK